LASWVEAGLLFLSLGYKHFGPLDLRRSWVGLECA
jgi:hypothetical protein